MNLATVKHKTCVGLCFPPFLYVNALESFVKTRIPNISKELYTILVGIVSILKKKIGFFKNYDFKN